VTAHEQLAGNGEFFFTQIDTTEEFGGFLYAKEPKFLVDSLKEFGLK
jgi:hypothetical protein